MKRLSVESDHFSPVRCFFILIFFFIINVIIKKRKQIFSLSGSLEFVALYYGLWHLQDAVLIADIMY